MTNEEVYAEVRRAICDGRVEIQDIEAAATDLIEFDAELWDAKRSQVIAAIERVQAESASATPKTVGALALDVLATIAIVGTLAVVAWSIGKVIAAGVRWALGGGQ